MNESIAARPAIRNRALRIAAEVLLWALALFLIYVFGRAGLDKFDDAGGWARAFRFWGYPVWFRMVVGATELAAAALLLWRRTAAYGALLIVGVMLGGMGTHVLVEGRPGRVTSELGQLVFSSIVLTGRWRQRIPLSRR